MTQVNKYATIAAYTADESRLTNRSALSLIENEGTIRYDGVNILVDETSAQIADLVVFDTVDLRLKFVKSKTLNTAILAANLLPLAVVYDVQGDLTRIVSLNNIGTHSWAAAYEVLLSGFDLAAGGAFTIKIAGTDYPLTYAANSTLEAIEANINAISGIVAPAKGRWVAKAAPAMNGVVMSSTPTDPAMTKITVSGCSITYRQEDIDYQTSLTGALIGGASENIRKRNGVDASSGGANLEKLMQYYGANGFATTNVPLGSSQIIKEAVFNATDNPLLVAAYATYADYLFGEHFMQYPTSFGAALRDGRRNTSLIGRLQFVDIYGKSAACYPAAAAALGFDMAVEGLEAGAWWLPAVNEIFLAIRTTKLDWSDAINSTLKKIPGADMLQPQSAWWLSAEFNNYRAYIYSGAYGSVSVDNKYGGNLVRPVSIFPKQPKI